MKLTKSFYRKIGSKGGRKSKRVLTAAQSRKMNAKRWGKKKC